MRKWIVAGCFLMAGIGLLLSCARSPSTPPPAYRMSIASIKALTNGHIYFEEQLTLRASRQAEQPISLQPLFRRLERSADSSALPQAVSQAPGSSNIRLDTTHLPGYAFNMVVMVTPF